MHESDRLLQLWLDPERYDTLKDEALATGRSMAAVIREAIDRLLSSVPVRD